MTRFASLAVVICFGMSQVSFASDWTWWRGPTFNGIAAEGQTPPTSWSESKNIVWKATVPGRGTFLTSGCW